jgi:hypothetical protein
LERVSGWDDNAESKTRPIGDALDSLGIEATLDPDELVAGAMVLLKVMQADGDTRLSLAHQGVGWIERVGMLRVAETLEAGSLRDATDDE